MNKLFLSIVFTIFYGFSFVSFSNGAYFFDMKSLFNIFQYYPCLSVLTQLDATNKMHNLGSHVGYFTNLEEIQSKALEGSNVHYFFLGEQNYRLYPGAFMNAYELRWLDLGGVEEIPTQCFENCLNLKIVIGKSVRKINFAAFSNCPKIELLYFPNLQDIDLGAFRGSNIRFLIVPEFFIDKVQAPGITLMSAEQIDCLDALCLTDV